MVVGEGPSDMGICRNPQDRCSGVDFQAGPMAVMIRQIVDGELSKIRHGWNLDEDAIEFISKAALKSAVIPKDLPASSLLLPSKKNKRHADDIHFFRQARVLGYLAQQRAKEANCEVAAVLFRDADLHRSHKVGLWEEKAKSMQDGFAIVSYELGVPMVANPTSEAWLLCGLQPNPYHNCKALESEVSASDKSEKWGKKLVSDAIADRELEDKSFGELVSEGYVDTHRINMPSFNAFRDRLVDVVAQMVPEHPKNRHSSPHSSH